jgi:thioredoxin 1
VNRLRGSAGSVSISATVKTHHVLQENFMIHAIPNVRARLWTAFLACLLVPTFSMASELQRFDAAKFASLQAESKPVVVVVHADWCGICKKQVPIQAELMRSPEFADFTMFEVDFDKDKDLLKRFNVIKQGTIIVFQGKTEVARTLGETQREAIRATLLKGKT